MTDYKLVPVEPTQEMVEAARQHHEGEAYLPVSLYKAMLAAAPAVQGEPVGYIRRSAIELMESDELGVRANIIKEPRYRDCVPLYLAPQPAEQQPAPDVAGLVEALEFARDDLQDWMESFLDAFHDPTVKIIERIDAALAAHRKQGGK